MVRHTSLAVAVVAVATAPIVLASSSTVGKATAKCVSCNPTGWRSTNGPAVGSDMIPLYVNLVQSVKSIHFKRDTLAEALKQKRASAPICCTDGAQCVLLSTLLIPFCYDKYTTNFLFPDGSKGIIATGQYNTTTPGETINLITGNVTNTNSTSNPNNNGTNIYASNYSLRPNTSTLAIPPVYTAAGDGMHITSLGKGQIMGATGATTIPASTVLPTTIAAFTGNDGIVTPARTIAGTTIPAVTVAAVESKAAAAAAAAAMVQLRRPEDSGRMERIVTLYIGVLGVFGGLAMVL